MAGAPDKVGGVMTKGEVTVGPPDAVRTALRTMLDHDMGAVTAAEGDGPVGALPERDLRRRILDDAALLDGPVGEAMSSPVVTTDRE